MIKTKKVGTSDWPEIVTLNNDAVPHVNALSLQEIQRIGGEARLALRTGIGTGLAGFVIALGPGADYDSPNYRWFVSRYPDFLYVDRIVVAPTMRGQGIARGLYEKVFEAAGAAPVCCEVNLRPPNESSMRFHVNLGFSEVGRQLTEGGTKEVALLANRSG